MAKTSRVPWEYRGVVVLPADRNSSGIRWSARTGNGVGLRSDTKAGMRSLIRKERERQ